MNKSKTVSNAANYIIDDLSEMSGNEEVKSDEIS
jgi:hypothetical protein